MKKLFLKILQNSLENTYVGASFFDRVAVLVNFAKFVRTFFFCRTPPMAVCVAIKNLTDRYKNSILFQNEGFYEVYVKRATDEEMGRVKR